MLFYPSQHQKLISNSGVHSLLPSFVEGLKLDEHHKIRTFRVKVYQNNHPQTLQIKKRLFSMVLILTQVPLVYYLLGFKGPMRIMKFNFKIINRKYVEE